MSSGLDIMANGRDHDRVLRSRPGKSLPAQVTRTGSSDSDTHLGPPTEGTPASGLT
ncbi:Sterol O-acyltransferase 2 (Sterol-ester synthase 2), partial [Conoideocrella luteorostrata]